ncbi:MAG: serine/threonine protein kinase [Acidobacteria bacterium]|nr:MAG: serine/threonine protein kinase [Acidobacteriota bacterium]
MSFRYSAFGLDLICDRPLPHVDASEDAEEGYGPSAGSVAVSLSPWSAAEAERAADGDHLLYRSRLTTEDGCPLVAVARRRDRTLAVRYADGTSFFLAADGSRIDVRWHAPSNLRDAATYLLGPILGLILRLRGVVTLHASAVVVDDHAAIALAGQAGAGKSTTAAAFAQHGFPILSDDMTVLREDADGFMVEPDFGVLKLWPQASQLLLGGADLLPHLSPTWDKRYLNLRSFGLPAARQARPLAAIYLLDREPAPGANPEIDGLRRLPALMALLVNTYGLMHFDRDRQAQELDVLARLATRVLLRRVRRPARGLAPPQVVETILSDLTVHAPAIPTAG